VGKDSADEAGVAHITLAAVLELILQEYHLTPEYVLDHWTSDMLELVMRKRADRMERVRAELEQDNSKKYTDQVF